MIVHLGGIYLKNMIAQYWKDRDPSELIDDAPPFVIVEQDKATIRENIVEAVIHAPELIRYGLISFGCRNEVLHVALSYSTFMTIFQT